MPLELWSGEKPNLSHLRVFGCVAFALKSKDQLDGKLDERGKKCIMLGYVPNGYRLRSKEERKVVRAYHVKFDGSRSKFNNDNEIEYGTLDEGDFQVMEEDGEILDQGEQPPDPPEHQEQQGQHLDHDQPEDQPLDHDQDQVVVPEVEEFEHAGVQGVRRGARVRVRPQYLQDYTAMALLSDFVDSYTGDCTAVVNSQPEHDYAMSALNYCNNVPTTYTEISGRDDELLWRNAVKEELSSLIENKTWDLVSLPPNKRPINCKWVFTIKDNSDGGIDRYKARLVVKGCSQRPGVDFQETYAPVARLTTVRAFLSLVSYHNMHLNQLDVKNAFLNGDLHEEIYMWPPEGLNVKDGTRVCRLRKALYGLKQAPMEWNNKFDQCAKDLGFQRCQSEQCVYKRTTNNVYLYLLLYVDDFLIACDNPKVLAEVKAEFMKTFKMRDLGDASYFLGIKITRTEAGMFSSQENYINKLAEKFAKGDVNSKVKTPMEVKPPRDEPNASTILGREPYRELIGSLMFACMATRPDICAAVNHFSQYQTKASANHWKGLCRILRYLKSTAKWGLWFKSNWYNPLALYVDADHANAPDRRSVSGFVVKMYGNTVAWATRKQTSVATSTTEAEYIALATGVKEILWLRQLFRELEVEGIDQSIPVFEDNKGCINALDKWDSKRLKHVDIKYNFVKELHQNKTITVEYLCSNDQVADIMTKGLETLSFMRHRENLGMSALNLN